jgi:hypothetical protein
MWGKEQADSQERMFGFWSNGKKASETENSKRARSLGQIMQGWAMLGFSQSKMR